MRLTLILVIVAALALVLWFSFGRSDDAWAVPDREGPVATAHVELDGEDLDDVTREPERSDSAAELEPVVPARMLRPDDPMALLRVRVIDVANRKPISGAHVTFRTFGTLPPTTPGGRPEDEAFPTMTCGEGLAVHMIQPRAFWEILVAPELGMHARSHGEALAASEERDVLVEVTTAPDGVLCGRVLAPDTNLPIANAIVRIEPKHELVPVAADGTFRAELRSWRDEGLEVRAAGYGPRWVARTPGHETQGQALAIVLDRGASLRVTVLDSSGSPLHRVSVEIAAFRGDLSPEPLPTTAGRSRSSWEVTTAIDGIAEWVDLPAGVSLAGKVRRYGVLLHQEPEPIVLSAGELSTLTWRLAATSEILGVVLEAGTPVPGQVLWLQPSKGERELILGFGYGEERRRATADASGRFRFQHVTPGSWWLSPAEPDFGKREPSRDPIALGQLVEVPETTSATNVEVNLQRGLVIRGRILTPDGGVPVGGGANASRKGVQQRVFAIVDTAGEFVLGPLLPGTWSLVAHGRDHLPSEPIQVEAGTTNVVLSLRPQGELQVRVLGADGLPVPSVRVFVTPQRWYDLTGETDPSGLARIREIPLGLVSVGCLLPDGRCGFVAGVPVELDHVNAVDLELQPGVRGTIRLVEGETPANVSIFRDGAMLGSADLVKGKPCVVTMPTGRVSLRLFTGRKYQGDHEVMIASGTTPEFTFDGAWR